MKIKNFIVTILVLIIVLLIGTQKIEANSIVCSNFTGMYIVTTEVKKGENVYVEFYGMDDITSVKVYMMGEDNDYLSADVVDFKTRNPYFVMPDSAKEGKTYTITLIEISCEHGTVQYSTSEDGINYRNCFGRNYIKIIESTTETNIENTGGFHNFTGMYVVTTEVKKGEKVYVEFYGMDDITSVKVYMMGEDNDYLSADVVDFKTRKPYFIMPDIAKEGKKYTITLIEITCEHGTIRYSTSEGGTEYVTNCFEKKYVKVIENEEEIALTKFALANPNNIIKKGENERLYLNVELKGADKVDFITMSVVSKEQKNTGALVSLQNDSGLQYIDLINIGTQYPLANGEYYISDLYINPSKEDYIRYSTDKNATNALPLEYNVEFKVENIEEEKNDNTTILKNIKLLQEKGKLNEKIYVDLDVENFELNQLMLSFYNSKNDNNIVTYLKDIKNTPYFNVPYTTELGEYELNYVILRDINGTERHYRKGETISNIEHFDFNAKLIVEESDFGTTDILNLDNDKITMDIIQKINQLDSNITIEIEASSNPIVSKSLFEAIKGQDKILKIKYNDVEWIFNGNDIKNSKTIDVSVQITNNIEDLNGKVNKGIMIEFAENGELPGKCLIRVYNSNLLNENFNQDKSNIYFYDESRELFNKIALNVNITDDGYYEFYIKHNSSYIMTQEEISDEYIIEETEEINDIVQIEENVTENNNRIENVFSNKILMIILVLGILIIMIIIIMLRKTGKKD